MPRRILCPCTLCKGNELVTTQDYKRHAARDRRELSTVARNNSSTLPNQQDSSTSSRSTAPNAHAAECHDESSHDDPAPIPGPFEDSVGVSLHQTAPAVTPEAASAESFAAEPDPDVNRDDGFEPISRDDWEEPDYPQDEDEPAMASTSDPPFTIELSSFAMEEDDPFQYTPGATATATPTHMHPVIYMAYLLVFWLHAQCHLSFRACNAVLACLAVMFRSIGMSAQLSMYETLPSVMSSLGANPSFQVAPVCPLCMRVYPPSTPADTLCGTCAIPLFLKKPSAATRARHTPGAPESVRPALQFPYKSLEEQLATMLAVAGIEDEIERSLNKLKSSVPGKYTNVFDGRICQELCAPDGTKFFSPSKDVLESGELRVAVSLGVDWFSYLRSQIAPSHTSCPMSYSIMSLPPHLRYRTSNLLLAGIMPGPKEADVDQVHHFMRVLVNELLRLWRDGVVIKTPKYPEGRLVRVILIAVVCDKPAAHKLGGFGSHAHQFFCTQCWVRQDDKATPASFSKGGFAARSNSEQRELHKKYLQCRTNAAREAFVRKHATRWSELSRLPYFDLCRMIVIDPMHNLFLGLVKTHFYHIWVQLNVLRKTKELRRLHTILAEIKLPVKLGRLPSLVGEPAGGSLTADQWLVFATVVAPLAIPQIWEEYLNQHEPNGTLQRRSAAITQLLAAKKDAAAAARKKKTRGNAESTPMASTRPKRSRKPTQRALEQDIDPEDNNGLDAGAMEHVDDNFGEPAASKKRKRGTEMEPDQEAIDEATPCNLHAKDPQNFMKLSIALRILISRTVYEEDLVLADKLMREYCSELVEIYGASVIRPNHHYAVHTADSVRDYGPLHEFWTFLFERMNKVLKSYKTGNHSGGELETSFFREFHRTVQASRLLGQGASPLAPEALQACVRAMYNATDDDRGTVQALSRELDEAQEDEGVNFQLSMRAEHLDIPRELYHMLLVHFRQRGLEVHSDLTLAPSSSSIMLSSRAVFFDHVTINNTRYSSAHRRINSAAESLLAAQVSSDGRLWVGELLDIFLVDLSGVGRYWFGHMQWLEPITFDISQTFWNTFKVLNVSVWKADMYLPSYRQANVCQGPPPLILLQDIICPAIRFKTTVRNEPCWVTVLQERNGFLRPKPPAPLP